MRILACMALLFCVQLTLAQNGLSWRENKKQKKLELLYNGKLLTAYCDFDSVEKPVLFPINTISGTTVTRGYPIAPRPGERTDHPHHVGLWLTYESVNGLDFWNNSFAIPAEKKHLYGSILPERIIDHKADRHEASLTTLSHWVDPKKKVLMEETTVFTFYVKDNDFIIDRKSSWKARENIQFKDVKDGLLGIRVARELEMPSTQKDTFIDAHGNVTETAALNNEGVTGLYHNKEGVTGDATWGTRSQWTYLSGKIKGEDISIVMIDHPSNVGYPTYWHARGYGLFAANPLGQSIFSNGKEQLNYSLPKGQSTTLQYRIVIHGGSVLRDSDVDGWMKDFHSKK
jgi:hypothetical protein